MKTRIESPHDLGKKVASTFTFIKNHIDEFGWAPTTTEIAKGLHKRPMDITRYLNILKEHKFIIWEGSRKIKILQR